MLLRTPAEFSALVDALAAHLRASAAEFALRNELGELDVVRVRQKTTDMRDVAVELLTFGIDVWPANTAETTVIPFPIRSGDAAEQPIDVTAGCSRFNQSC